MITVDYTGLVWYITISKNQMVTQIYIKALSEIPHNNSIENQSIVLYKTSSSSCVNHLNYTVNFTLTPLFSSSNQKRAINSRRFRTSINKCFYVFVFCDNCFGWARPFPSWFVFGFYRMWLDFTETNVWGKKQWRKQLIRCVRPEGLAHLRWV